MHITTEHIIHYNIGSHKQNYDDIIVKVDAAPTEGKIISFRRNRYTLIYSVCPRSMKAKGEKNGYEAEDKA